MQRKLSVFLADLIPDYCYQLISNNQYSEPATITNSIFSNNIINFKQDSSQNSVLATDFTSGQYIIFFTVNRKVRIIKNAIFIYQLARVWLINKTFKPRPRQNFLVRQ